MVYTVMPHAVKEYRINVSQIKLSDEIVTPTFTKQENYSFNP